MEQLNLPIQWAPEHLNQAILPGWNVSLFSVNLGETSNADVEKAAIAQVGSYGKQIGHLSEALEVVIQSLGLLERADISTRDKDALKVLLGDAATARRVKSKLNRP